MKKKKKHFLPLVRKALPLTLSPPGNVEHPPLSRRTPQTDDRPDGSRLDHAASATELTLSENRGQPRGQVRVRGPFFSPTLSPIYL